MSKPTESQEAAIFEAEEHAATLSRVLDILKRALANAEAANDRRLIAKLDAEIGYHARKLMETKARRTALSQALGGKGESTQ